MDSNEINFQMIRIMLVMMNSFHSGMVSNLLSSYKI